MIEACPFDDPRLAAVLAERRRDLERRYAGVTDHPADPTATDQFVVPVGISLVALIEGVPSGIGALRELEPGVAEIKRMYVVERSRRRGLGTAVLRALENQGRQLGYTTVRLETGTQQPEAMAFYERMGYTRIDCYERWSGYPLSVCFEKTLTAE